MAFESGTALLSLALPTLAALGASYAFDWPRIGEMRRNAKLRAAVKRANTETVGLRNTIEGIEMRLRDTRAAIAGIDENLRHTLQKMPARDQSALGTLIGQGTFAGLLSMLRTNVLVDRRLDALKRAWSRDASERQCAQALCENLWILEPSLVSEGHIFVGKTLGTVAESYFSAAQATDDLAKAAAKKKPSAVGMFRRRSAIANAAAPGQRTLVIVEAHRPGESVGQAVIAMAIGYAHAIRKLVPDLADWPVECIVIGGTIAEDAQLAANNGPPGTPIHLTTWEALKNLARTRRPETISLQQMRFDADQPPHYDLRAETEGLGAFLGLEDDPAATNAAHQDQA